MYRIFCSSLSFKVRILHWAQHTSAVHFPRTPLKRIHSIPRDKKKKTRPWLWKFLTFISFIHLARCFGGISRGCSFCCGMRKGQIQQCAEPHSSRAAQSSLYTALLMNEYERVVSGTHRAGSALYSCMNVCSRIIEKEIIMNCCRRSCSLSVVLKRFVCVAGKS